MANGQFCRHPCIYSLCKTHKKNSFSFAQDFLFLRIEFALFSQNSHYFLRIPITFSKSSREFSEKTIIPEWNSLGISRNFREISEKVRKKNEMLGNVHEFFSKFLRRFFEISFVTKRAKLTRTSREVSTKCPNFVEISRNSANFLISFFPFRGNFREVKTRNSIHARFLINKTIKGSFLDTNMRSI